MRGGRVSLGTGAALLVGAMLSAGGVGWAGGAPARTGAVTAVPLARVASDTVFKTPPTLAQCERVWHQACYRPYELQRAYDLGPLYAKGLDGKGKTIVLVESFGYSGIRGELATYDKALKLPPPPSFRIITPDGPVPPYNPKRPDMQGWALETTMDVEVAHSLAPGANILLAETPVSENLGRSGFPQIVEAENYVIDHHLGTVISQSFTTAEQTFTSKASILSLRSAYKNAAAHGVSVLTSAGDYGASGAEDQGSAEWFTHRVVSWPASDPLVTGVGGTQLDLTVSGTHVKPDQVWNQTPPDGSGLPAASGGGQSVIFSRPAYQNAVARVTGPHRGEPDLSMAASGNGGEVIYEAGLGYPFSTGYSSGAGTSQAAPLLAAIVAIADQYAGHGLGLLNPALYKMYAQHEPGIVDVTSGNNTVSFKQAGHVDTVRGFAAAKGYDLASGLGTVNAALFVPELVKASGG
jgi:subtilase family serine protease